MTCGRQLPSPVSGLFLSALLGLLATSWPSAADAQFAPRDGPSTGIGPFATTVQPQRPARRQPVPAQTPDYDDSAPLQRLQAPQPAAQPPAGETQADPNAPSETTDDDPRPALAPRTIVDGDPSFPGEPRQPVDGVVDTGESAPAADPAQGPLDARSPEDVAAFESPPAGYDPSIYAVELDPILDRRPEQLYRFEPFQAVGYTAGSFTVYPELIASSLATSNLYRTSTARQSDIALELRPSLRAVSNWKVHAVEVRASGLTSFYADHPAEDMRAYTLEARTRIDVTRRTNFELLTSVDHTPESRGSINAASTTGDRSEIDTTRAQLTFNQRFNRLSVQLRGSVVETEVSAVRAANGTLDSNLYRDNTYREGVTRVAWAFKPTLSVFGEVAVNARDYRAPSTDGLSRDSTGERTRAGLSFGNTGQVVRGEISVGYGRQKFDESRLPEIDGILLDANLAWRISGITALLLQARTDVSESQVANSGGALSRTLQGEVRHELTKRLIGTAGVRWTSQDYVGTNISETEIAGLLGLEYYVNRDVTVFGRYSHVDFASNVAGRSYQADEARIGVRVRH